MDIADIFRKGLQNLHKDNLDKNYKKRSILSRKESLLNLRRQTRDTLLFSKRKIEVDMSPYITPTKSNKKNNLNTVKPNKDSIQKVNPRWEMLKQWKEKRNKQKEDDKKRAKPIFKVCHVQSNIGLPNLENVNREIKGKPIKSLQNSTFSSFAPINHKFSAPINIKPIRLVNTGLKNSQEQKYSQHKQEVQAVQSVSSNKTGYNFSKNKLDVKNDTNAHKVIKGKSEKIVSTRPNTRNKTAVNKFEKNEFSNSKVESSKKSSYSKSSNTLVDKTKLGNNKSVLPKSHKSIDTTSFKTKDKMNYNQKKLTPKSNQYKITKSIESKYEDVNLKTSPHKTKKIKKNQNKPTPKSDQYKITKSFENKWEDVIAGNGVISNKEEKVVIYDDDEITVKTPIKTLNSLILSSKKDAQNDLLFINLDSNDSTFIGSKVSNIRNIDLTNGIHFNEEEKVVIYDDDEITVKTPLKKLRKSRIFRETLQNISPSKDIILSSIDCTITPGKTPQPSSSRRCIEKNIETDVVKTPLTDSDQNKTTPKKNGEIAGNKTIAYNEASTQKTPISDVTRQSVYISPFVTISRGKDSARKEYKIRQSTGGVFISPEGKSYADNTTPQAAAEYFEKVLNNQIERIESMCATWLKYKEDNDVSEDTDALINVAIGQSRLLITKKFEQFRGLILECKNFQYKEKMITCEDLHGFWDMIYHQVINLDNRFENLEKLKNNNWEELLPEKKVVPKRGRGRPKKTTTSSSSIKDVIKAAREKIKANSNEIEQQPKTPPTVTQFSADRSMSTRRSLRVSLLRGSTIKRNSSPGLTMMKITQAIKAGDGLTPNKSILKTDVNKSVKSRAKSVLFVDDVGNKISKTLNFDDDDKENSTNMPTVYKERSEFSTSTPLRRSKRFSKAT